LILRLDSGVTRVFDSHHTTLVVDDS